MVDAVSRDTVREVLDALPEEHLPIAESVLRTLSRPPWRAPSSFEHLMGFETLRLEEGVGTVRIQVEPHLLNPNGVLHGASCSPPWTPAWARSS